MGQTELIINLIFYVVLIALLGAIIIFIREYRAKKKAHDQEIIELDEIHKKELIQNEYEIQQETMKNIGREIHDSVGQKLTLATLLLHSFPGKKESKEAESKIQEIADVIHESLAELRNLSKNLTNNRIENLSIQELIEYELKKIKNLKTIHVHSDIDPNVYINSYQIKAVLLRITQEFIQNCLKHSNCENIYIELAHDENTITLKLKDDGKGFKMSKLNNKGLGLKNIKKRGEIINAKLKLKSILNKGTILEIKIPNHEK